MPDDLQDIEPGSFSNHTFASVRFKAARSPWARVHGEA